LYGALNFVRIAQGSGKKSGMPLASLDLQPVLTGKQLRLRPLSGDDFEAVYSCASDPLIWAQHPQPNRYKREVFEVFFEGALKSGGAFAALLNGTGEIIGSSRFYDLRTDRMAVTIGYTFMARKCWGKSLNREMKQLMLKHAFEVVDRVFFEIGKCNLRSIKAIERIGAKLVEERELESGPHLRYRIQKTDFL
jgi:RimJ/RimL family protein N-acetyltransferase